MRAPRRIFLAIALAALLAGCAQPAATTDPAGGAGAAAATEAAPFEAVDLAHDYAQGGGGATFAIPDGVGPLQLRAWIAANAQGVCVTPGVTLTVFDPSGAVFATVGGDMSALSVANDVCHPGVDATMPLAPGEWRVAFEGTGAGAGRVVVARP